MMLNNVNLESKIRKKLQQIKIVSFINTEQVKY